MKEFGQFAQVAEKLDPKTAKKEWEIKVQGPFGCGVEVRKASDIENFPPKSKEYSDLDKPLRFDQSQEVPKHEDDRGEDNNSPLSETRYAIERREASSIIDPKTEKEMVGEGEQFDEKGKLKPNIIYRSDDGTGRNYTYETDSHGRIVKVTASNLELKTRSNRLEHQRNTPEKELTDDSGHLIGDRFGGSNKLDNLISQDSHINQVEYKKLENEWEKALKEGKSVSVDIEVQYEGDSKRPTGFNVTYIIDGEVTMKYIPNKSV